MIGPPYFLLDEASSWRISRRRRAACAPLPFYVYEFARTSGYPDRARRAAAAPRTPPNFAGLKVSDTPWEAFEPYLSLGLDVLRRPGGADRPWHRRRRGRRGVGARRGIPGAGGRGRPRAECRAGAAGLATLRAAVERFPRQAAMKRILASAGVPVGSAVRAPLRDLTTDEARLLDEWLASS